MSGPFEAKRGYRDEREAAFAQIESLRAQLSKLEHECARLRQENEELRSQLGKHGVLASQLTSSASFSSTSMNLVFVNGELRTESTEHGFWLQPISSMKLLAAAVIIAVVGAVGAMAFGAFQ